MIGFRNIVCIILLAFATSDTFAYKNVPALVHLNKYEQPDTLGYNLISSLCSLLYEPILNGEIKLYTGPDQSIQMDSFGLRTLELSSGKRFDSCVDMFLYEYWSSNRKSTTFQVNGISFVAKNYQGQKISFGFLDFRSIETFLKSNLIAVNANGYAGFSYFDIIYSRRYVFHLIQMGEETFSRNPELAVKLKREAFYSGKSLLNSTPLEPTKEIEYRIDKKRYHTDIDFSNDIIRAIENSLKENPELLLNHYLNTHDSTPWRNHQVPGIQSLVVIETWTKTHGRPVIYDAKIKLVFSDGETDFIPLGELETIGLVIQFQSIRDFLQTKPFLLELNRINQQDIPLEKGEIYMKALMGGAPWTQLNHYANR